jgi:hypothetical protein
MSFCFFSTHARALLYKNIQEGFANAFGHFA